MIDTDYVNNLKEGEALQLCQKTENIATIIALTKHQNALVRKKALIQLCPCRVRIDIEIFWSRILEMIDDPEAIVRNQVNSK